MTQSKKDEAAALSAKQSGELYSWLRCSHCSHDHIVGFDKGWTQHGDELIKMARSKAEYIDLDDLNGDFIKLSDLEAIVKSMEGK